MAAEHPRGPYETLGPLRVRLETHRRYTRGVDRLDDDTIEALALSGREAVLDIGCGTGAFLAELRARGHAGRLVGLDASAAAVASGRVRLPDAEWVAGDAASLPFGAATFDRALARHMLYHLARPQEALVQARRVLRPGGVLVVTVNVPRPYPRLMRLVHDALAAHGLASDEPGGSTVDADTARALLEQVFREVTVRQRRSCLVFPDARPVAAYAVSLLELFGVTSEHPSFGPVTAWIEAEARRRMGASGAGWSDEKGYAVFRARSTAERIPAAGSPS